MFPSPTDGTAIAQEAMRRKALQPPEVQPAQAQTPAAAITTLAAPSKVRGIGPLPGSPEAAHLNQLQTLQNSPSGISAIAQHPGIGHQIAGHALQALDAVGSAFFPAIAAGIPGTQLHHNVLTHQAANAVANDQAQQAAADTSRLSQAKAVEAESLPELNQAKAELAAEKLHSGETQKELDRQSREGIAGQRADTQQGIADQRIEASLRQHQLRRNAQGEIEPIPYEELTPNDQISHDMKEASVQVAGATAALKEAMAKNQPALIENARARLATAQQNANTAIERLRLSQNQFEAGTFGTVGGKAIPGAPADAEGNPIGLKTAAITKPTTATRSAAEQGGVIKEAGDKLIQEIDAKKGKVGNLGSYWNQYVNGTPISDPDISGLMASIGSFAALQPKLHGFRGQAALKEFEKIIGGAPKNPEALKAAIRSIQGTAGIVEGRGTQHTVSPQGASGAVRKYNPATGKLE